MFFLYEQTVCTADKLHHATTCSSRREDSPHTGTSVHLFWKSLRFLSIDADESQTLLLLLSVCVHACEYVYARTPVSVCARPCVSVRARECVCGHARERQTLLLLCVCACTSVCVWARTHVSVCAHVHECMFVCARRRTHVCGRAGAHMRVLLCNVIHSKDIHVIYSVFSFMSFSPPCGRDLEWQVVDALPLVILRDVCVCNQVHECAHVCVCTSMCTGTCMLMHSCAHALVKLRVCVHEHVWVLYYVPTKVSTCVCVCVGRRRICAHILEWYGDQEGQRAVPVMQSWDTTVGQNTLNMLLCCCCCC